jgi:hypothetical protein
MEYAAGLIVGAAIAALGALVGLDKDRSFYPTVLMVIAAYYVLFAVMGGSYGALVVEIIVAAVFFAVAITGFWKSLWIVAAGLIAHGFLDLLHPRLIHNPEVPEWWPGFCLVVDLTLGVWLGVLATKRSDYTLGPTP